MMLRRVLFVWALLFVILVFFLPLLPCLPEQPVAAKVCKANHVCMTDRWYTLATVLSSYDAGFDCPGMPVPFRLGLVLLVLALVAALVLAVLSVAAYSRWRDV